MTDTRSNNNPVLIFIPTFNDVELLESLTSEIHALSDEYSVLVIDDGSSVTINPPTVGSDCHYFRLPANFGLGLCTHIAFDHALRHNYRAIVRIDADGQHPVKNIPDYVAMLDAGEADLVVASRTNRNARNGTRGVVAGWMRGYLSFIARLLTRGHAPKDVNSGFFVANRRVAETLNAFQLERYPEPQMYILACRRGLKLKDVEVEQIAREHGESSIALNQALRIFYRFNIFVLAELLQRSKAE